MEWWQWLLIGLGGIFFIWFLLLLLAFREVGKAMDGIIKVFLWKR